MNYYLEQLERAMEAETAEVNAIEEKTWECSEAFMDIVREQGDVWYALTDYGVVALYSFNGEYYYKEWLLDGEIGPDVVPNLLSNIVHNTEF